MACAGRVGPGIRHVRGGGGTAMWPGADGGPESGAISGVDLSHWDGTVPYAALREAGHRFVIAKASQGVALRDPAFARHVAGARAAGMDVGAYHFFDYRLDGRAQADLLLAVAAEAGLGVGALPVVVDVECFARFASVPVADAVARLEAMVARLYERTGRLPMLYTSRSMWSRVTGGDERFGDLPLWVACWRCARPLLPAGWSDHLVWQTGAVTLPGRARRMDGNVILGGESALAGLRAREPRVEGAGGVPGGTVVLDLGSLGGANVRWRVAGGAWSGWAAWVSSLLVTVPAAAGPAVVEVQGRDRRGTLGPVARVEVPIAVPPETERARLAIVGIQRGTSATRDGRPSAAVAIGLRRRGTDPGSAALFRTTCATAPRTPAARPAASLVESAFTVRLDRRWCRVRVRPARGAAIQASPTWWLRAQATDAAPSATTTVGEGWTARPAPGMLGGSLLVADQPGAAIEMEVTGRVLALVGPRGPGWAPLGVQVDEGPVERVDPAPDGRGRSTVWWSRVVRGGLHRVRIVALDPGTGSPLPAAIDGLLAVQLHEVASTVVVAQ